MTRLGFLLLDKTLGELNVEMWIGAIEFVRENPDDAVPISEFTDVLQDLNRANYNMSSRMHPILYVSKW